MVMATDHNALERLGALFVTFFDQHPHADRVTHAELQAA